MRKLSSVYYQVKDVIHDDDIGLIVTNFTTPNDNYLASDRDSLQINIIYISDVQKRIYESLKESNYL